VRPRNTQEVVDLVKTGRKIRCIGTGHSWSELAPTDDILMATDSLNRILSINNITNTATIQAGAKLENLNTELWAQGYSFSNLGSIARQSLAGAISTATHGSGINFQVLASQVTNFKLVNTAGEIVVIDKVADADLFNSAIISLGSLGIVTEMTIKIDPKFLLHERSGLMDFEEACDNILDLVNEHNHIKMWWFPHTDKMMVYRYNRTYEPIDDTWFRQKFMDEWVSVYFYRFMLWWGNRKPSRRKKINNRFLVGLVPEINRIERSYNVFNVPEPPLHRETEWSFDIKLTPTLLREYRNMVEDKGHLINFIQEIRFVKGDDFSLSPCYGRDSVYVGAYNADDRGWDELLADFEENIGVKYEGRPHWGKEFNVGTEYLKSVYPKWKDFETVRKEMDPEGQFMNPMLNNIFR
jgi:L-gulonolactone oxidase